MKLVLIRHGRTEANARRLYCGASDLPLTAEGRAELEALRARANYPDVRGLLKVSSGLRRADETMEILFGAAPELRAPGFREMDFGRFELKSYAELRDDPEYQAWIMDESGDLPTPGGESARAFRARVYAAADALDRDALVLCHGGVIAALMARWFPEEARNLYQWQPDGGLGYAVELGGARPRYRAIDCAR